MLLGKNEPTMKGYLVLLFVAGALAAPKENPCHRACPEMWAPVCSTDGRTFPSACEFQAYQCEQGGMQIQVTIAHGGECEEIETGCPKVCPSIHAPVCGSDGQTYDNECKLEYASCRAYEEDGVEFHLSHEGACVAAADLGQDECPIFCPSDWAPVCGSNGKTYTNECRLEVARCRSQQRDGPVVELLYAGVCKTPKAEEGREGESLMKRRVKCTLARRRAGLCRYGREEESCMKPCPKILNPVCATNGQTFGNECLFEVFQCLVAEGGDELLLAHEGPCGAS